MVAEADAVATPGACPRRGKSYPTATRCIPATSPRARKNPDPTRTRARAPCRPPIAPARRSSAANSGACARAAPSSVRRRRAARWSLSLRASPALWSRWGGVGRGQGTTHIQLSAGGKLACLLRPPARAQRHRARAPVRGRAALQKLCGPGKGPCRHSSPAQPTTAAEVPDGAATPLPPRMPRRGAGSPPGARRRRGAGPAAARGHALGSGQARGGAFGGPAVQRHLLRQGAAQRAGAREGRKGRACLRLMSLLLCMERGAGPAGLGGLGWCGSSEGLLMTGPCPACASRPWRVPPASPPLCTPGPAAPSPRRAAPRRRACLSLSRRAPSTRSPPPRAPPALWRPGAWRTSTSSRPARDPRSPQPGGTSRSASAWAAGARE
jgi:hypothetical protein